MSEIEFATTPELGAEFVGKSSPDNVLVFTPSGFTGPTYYLDGLKLMYRTEDGNAYECPQLTGPTCPICKIPMRRRRFWSQGDLARCRECGGVAECVDWSRTRFTFVHVSYDLAQRLYPKSRTKKAKA